MPPRAASRAVSGRTGVDGVNRLAGRGAARAHGATRGHAVTRRQGVAQRRGPASSLGITRRRGAARRYRTARRHGATRRYRTARGCGTARRYRAARRPAFARAHGLAGRRHGWARARRLAGPHAVTGWHGRHRRAGTWSVRYPAGADGAHPRRVGTARRLSPGPARRRPILAPSAAPFTAGGAAPFTAGGAAPFTGGGAACHRGNVGLASTRGGMVAWAPRGGRALWPAGIPGWPAGIPGHVEQAARRVHGRRLQHMRSARTCPRTTSGVAVAAARGSWRPPGPPRFPAPGEHENHEHDQAERDARRAHIQPEPGSSARRVRADMPHGRAEDHQDDAEHDRHGSRN